jgi:hypothetical protein
MKTGLSILLWVVTLVVLVKIGLNFDAICRMSAHIKDLKLRLKKVKIENENMYSQIRRLMVDPLAVEGELGKWGIIREGEKFVER